MLSQNSAAFRTSNVSDPARQILSSALLALDVECQRQSTGVHLMSDDKALVESLLSALDQAWGVQQAVRRHLLEEPTLGSAAELLERLAGETGDLRGRLWPTHSYACEALTRVLDILHLARESFSNER